MENKLTNRKAPLPDNTLYNARRLRQDHTKPEGVLWSRLRNRQLPGAKFRRQHPVGRYIVDFFCEETKLAIELDGRTHDHAVEQDAVRQQEIEAGGITVLRFTNEDVLRNLEGVLVTIAAHLSSNGSETEY